MTGRSKTTRERILAAFAELAPEAGVPDVDSVAQRAGVSRSTLYRHFSGIDAMLAALQEDAMARGAALVETHLGPALRGEPGASILPGVAAAFEAALGEPSGYRQVMRRDPAAARELAKRFDEFSLQIMVLAKRRGELDGAVDAQAAATAMIGMAISLLVAVDARQIEIDDALMVLDRYLRGLAA